MLAEVIKITVPASSANLGSGYDSLGIALDLRLKVKASKYAIGFQRPFVSLRIKKNMMIRGKKKKGGGRLKKREKA